MVIELNHTIVAARDAGRSAAFVADLLGLAPPTRFGPFHVVSVANSVSLDFVDTRGDLASQHYAFLVGEDDFDEIHTRLATHGITYWADPGQRQAGEINGNDGGRGCYFEDLDGHLLEIITRPYGSGKS